MVNMFPMESQVNRNGGDGLCSTAYAVFRWLNNVNFISGEKWLKLVFTSCWMIQEWVINLHTELRLAYSFLCSSIHFSIRWICMGWGQNVAWNRSGSEEAVIFVEEKEALDLYFVCWCMLMSFIPQQSSQDKQSSVCIDRTYEST